MIAPLAREMWDTDSTNYYYSSDQLFSSLNDGVGDFNEEAISQQYSTSGNGDSETISPSPGTTDKRLLVLYAALVLTRGEVSKAARNSIIHTNPAGRTDLSRIVEAMEYQAERLEEKIEKVRLLRGQTEVEKEVDGEDWGVELRGRPSSEAEGTGILDIRYTES